MSVVYLSDDHLVALLAEGVDRNIAACATKGQPFLVALLAEGVDRNDLLYCEQASRNCVALLAEGVDRNNSGFAIAQPPTTSPSSRRAWIEITSTRSHPIVRFRVALLAEGVDRNIHVPAQAPLVPLSPSSRRAWIEISSVKSSAAAAVGSPSSRRAWIEISRQRPQSSGCRVALLAEGVDRNLLRLKHQAVSFSRPPRGGRG